jgi:hypothetical protein
MLSCATAGVLALALPAGAAASTGAASAATIGATSAATAATAATGTLNAVSCTSPGACTTVGSYVSAAGQVTLAEGWDGSTWTVQSTPNPAGGSDDTLTGVSCGAASACLTVGAYFSGHGDSPLAETWNGTSWTLQSVPLPAGALGGVLNSVSCTSATACTAVGYYANSGNANVTLAESWNGTSFAVQKFSPPPHATTSTLGAVSCDPAPATSCEALGWDFPSGREIAKTLAEVWNGTKWTIQNTPAPTGAKGGSYPGGVSCGAASACTSAGEGINTAGHAVGWAQGWNGTAWADQAVPKPKGATAAILSAVSCVAAPGSDCTAVGYYSNGSAFLSYSVGWNGTGWAVHKTPEPAGSTAGDLAGVSCRSATACTAVGSVTNSSGVPVTLAEGWNGTKWTIEPTPVP